MQNVYLNASQWPLASCSFLFMFLFAAPFLRFSRCLLPVGTSPAIPSQVAFRTACPNYLNSPCCEWRALSPRVCNAYTLRPALLLLRYRCTGSDCRWHQPSVHQGWSEISGTSVNPVTSLAPCSMRGKGASGCSITKRLPAVDVVSLTASSTIRNATVL